MSYATHINTNSKDLNYDLEKLFALFKAESNKVEYKYKLFDLISLIKSIERVYQKDFKDKKIIFNLDYSNLTQREYEVLKTNIKIILFIYNYLLF